MYGGAKASEIWNNKESVLIQIYSIYKVKLNLFSNKPGPFNDLQNKYHTRAKTKWMWAEEQTDDNAMPKWTSRKEFAKPSESFAGSQHGQLQWQPYH